MGQIGLLETFGFQILIKLLFVFVCRHGHTVCYLVL